jgi:hypothetical protein
LKIKRYSFITTIFVALATLFFGIDLYKSWYSYDAFPVSQAQLPALDKKEILLTTKALSPEESKTFLGKDLLERGYQPIQLTIQNNSSKAYIMASDRIELPTASASDVAAKVGKSSLGREIGYKIAGFLFWPLMIPGTIDSLKTLKNQSDLKRELNAKTVTNEEITPYSTVTRVIFVPVEEYKSSFRVVLIDKSSQRPLTFDALT